MFQCISKKYEIISDKWVISIVPVVCTSSPCQKCWFLHLDVLQKEQNVEEQKNMSEVASTNLHIFFLMFKAKKKKCKFDISALNLSLCFWTIIINLKVDDVLSCTYSWFSLTHSRPCWCTKQWQNVAPVLHNNRIKFPKDYLHYCSVHQHGRHDVRCKSRIVSYITDKLRLHCAGIIQYFGWPKCNLLNSVDLNVKLLMPQIKWFEAACEKFNIWTGPLSLLQKKWYIAVAMLM